MKAILTFKLSDDVTLSIESFPDENCARCLRDIVRAVDDLKTKVVNQKGSGIGKPTDRYFDVNYLVEAVKELRD